MTDSKTLGDALLDELKRVREIVPLYEAIPEGVFAALLMKQDIATAEKAMLEGDIIRMMAAYESLKGVKL